MAAMPAQSCTLAHFEQRHVGTDGVDDTRHFMTGNPGILDPGPEAEVGERIAVANATGLHADAHVSGARLGK